MLKLAPGVLVNKFSIEEMRSKLVQLSTVMNLTFIKSTVYISYILLSTDRRFFFGGGGEGGNLLQILRCFCSALI